MAYYRRFPQAEVEEADYSAAAEAAGIRPGEPVSEVDDTLGPNVKAWFALTGSIFCSVTQCRVVNEADVIADLTSLMDQTDGSMLAKGYLRDVGPEDARLLDGVSGFSLRGMVCAGEPEANFIFAGEFFTGTCGHGRWVRIDAPEHRGVHQGEAGPPPTGPQDGLARSQVGLWAAGYHQGSRAFS